MKAEDVLETWKSTAQIMPGSPSSNGPVIVTVGNGATLMKRLAKLELDNKDKRLEIGNLNLEITGLKSVARAGYVIRSRVGDNFTTENFDVTEWGKYRASKTMKQAGDATAHHGDMLISKELNRVSRDRTNSKQVDCLVHSESKAPFRKMYGSEREFILWNTRRHRFLAIVNCRFTFYRQLSPQFTDLYDNLTKAC